MMMWPLTGFVPGQRRQRAPPEPGTADVSGDLGHDAGRLRMLERIGGRGGDSGTESVILAAMPRPSCQHPTNCQAVGRGGPCRRCDADAIAERAVALRERIHANHAEGLPLYAPRRHGRLVDVSDEVGWNGSGSAMRP